METVKIEGVLFEKRVEVDPGSCKGCFFRKPDNDTPNCVLNDNIPDCRDCIFVKVETNE